MIHAGKTASVIYENSHRRSRNMPLTLRLIASCSELSRAFTREVADG